MEQYDEEKAEELAEEASYKETLKAIAAQAQRYKSLFGEFPPSELAFTEIHDKIAEEMARRGLRPFRL